MEGSGNLLLQRGHVGLPAEPTQPSVAGPDAPHHVGAPGYAVAVGVVRVSERKDVGLRYGFQQSPAEHGRRDPGRNQQIGMRGAEGKFCERIIRLEQRVRSAVLVFTGHFPVVDQEPALRRHGQYRPVLQLAAVSRIRNRPARNRVNAGYAEPEQQPTFRVVVVRRRLSAPVQRVAKKSRIGR